MLKLGHLNVTVERERDTFLVTIQGNPYGLETRASVEELRSLAQYFLKAAERAARSAEGA